jgi:hypothetical protein
MHSPHPSARPAPQLSSPPAEPLEMPQRRLARSPRVLRVALELADLDTLTAPNFALFIFSDVRPLQGVAALFDWRLGGQLSTLLLRNRLKGEAGEACLVPIDGRLGRRRLFLRGLGPASGWQPQSALAHVAAVWSACAAAGGGELDVGAPAVFGRPAVEADFVAQLEARAGQLPGERTALRVLCRG